MGDRPTVIHGEQLREWLKNKSLSQTEAAKLCWVSPRTFRRWVAGSPPIPKGMWELLQVKVKEKE
jgi:hypothetical protein